MNLKDLFTKPDAVSITKNTAQDKVRLLREAIDYVFEINDYKEWAYYEDHNDQYIYFSMWYEPKQKYSQFKIAYTYNNNVVSLIEDEASFVTKLTDWADVPAEESDVEKSVLKVLKSFFSKEATAEIIKAFDDEQMISIEPVWRPAGEVDLHKDTISLEEVRKKVDNINKKIDKGEFQEGLFHLHKTESFKWQRAWVQEVDANLGGTDVKAGTPLISAKFFNEKAWELKKSGKWLAPSFGATGYKVEMENGHE